MERLFVALCLLGLCGSVTLANELKYPVDDDDGSADDEDYSGSGMEDFFTFTSDIANEHSGSMTTVHPIVVPVPTEPELSNVTWVAAEPTTEYTELIKQHEEVLEKLNPTQGSPVEQTTAHITTGKTTADDLDVNWHLHKDHEHHKTTSQSMVEEDATQGTLDKSHHVHIVPHAETTTSPPSDDEDLVVNHGITTSSPVQDGESVNDHIHNEVLESTPVADRAKTTESYEGMVFGVEEKPTTKAPLVDDSHGSEDPVVTTGPPDVEIVEGGVHYITETTIPPLNADDNLVHNMVTTPTQNVESDHSRATTPSEADKHHKHHHGHHHHGHHHHHNHTTTAHPTDSDGQHKVSPSEPADRFAPDQTDDLDDGQSVEKFTETPVDHPAESSTPIPDDRQPFGTEFPAPDESDSDVSESKEEEESGDDTDGKDLFFETNETGVGGANKGNERSAVIESGSSDASHGIMERKELLAGIIAGGAVGLIFASFLVGFVLYRMKKKDEGSYSLEEPKQSNGGYQKPREQREFFA